MATIMQNNLPAEQTAIEKPTTLARHDSKADDSVAAEDFAVHGVNSKPVDGLPSNGTNDATIAANGADSGAVATKLDLTVWNSVLKWLPSRNPDFDYWWHFTGPHVATLLVSADYSVVLQYDFLLFYWQHVVPTLGPAPTPGSKGPSLTTEDGTRIEYSWRWTEGEKAPEIRIAFDPYSSATGTLKDPLGLSGALNLFHDVAPHNKHVDLNFVYSFFNKMFGSPHQIYHKSDGHMIHNHIGIGLEFKQDAFLPKMYVRPRKTAQEDKSGLLSLDDWEQVVTDGFGEMTVVKNVFNFFRDEKLNPGLSLQPGYVGADIVKQSKGRLKLYCRDFRTSFNTVASILTMGGSIKLPQEALDGIWDLMRGVCGLPDDFSKDAEIPNSFAYAEDKSPENMKNLFWRVFGYYFEMGSGRDWPDIKLYIPTTHYGVSDQAVAEATTRWMEKNGRGKYVPEFWNSLNAISTHRRLDEGPGVMLWLALMVRNGKLQVTSYFAPEAYHPKRFEE